MFDWLADPQALVALVTLTALEIVLGIDNIIFISILASRLPAGEQDRARKLGLMLALGMRLLLVLSIAWIARLTSPLFTVLGLAISGRDLVLLIGGLFLIFKSTHEIHNALEGPEATHQGSAARASLGAVLVQIALIDIVFSLDSVITAVGMVREVGVMIAAVIISVGVMLFFSGPIARFVHRHPTFKMLALSFLLVIGVTLVADGLHQHIAKGYIYFAMAFSALVETLNIRVRRNAERPVALRARLNEDAAAP